MAAVVAAGDQQTVTIIKVPQPTATSSPSVCMFLRCKNRMGLLFVLTFNVIVCLNCFIVCPDCQCHCLDCLCHCLDFQFHCVYLQEKVDVRDLVQESYKQFWSISNRDIDRLRLKHRLLVVQVCDIVYKM